MQQREEQERQRRRAEETARQEAIARFPRRLQEEIRSTWGKKFDLAGFASSCGVPSGEARRIAEKYYAEMARSFVQDGVVTEVERRQLDWLAVALSLDDAAARAIEGRAKGEKYRRAVTDVLADGVVSAEESRSLEALRAGLGLSKSETYRMTSDLTSDAYIGLVRRMAYAGAPDQRAIRYLEDFKSALALDQPGVREQLRDSFRRLYREAVSLVIHDGEVTAEEESLLDWLRRESGLTQAEIGAEQAKVDRVKELSQIRRGRLPRMRTTKILNSGEICHWEGRCAHNYTTPAGRAQRHSGELTVTSDKVLFTTDNWGFDFAPSKIVDVVWARGQRLLSLKVSGRKGGGSYEVDDPELLEAVLCGVVRKHKYLLAEGFSTERRRHIPAEVRREVFTRDGGCCVQCSAQDYLEFDHVIPYSKGGANTVNNIQLLCRRCNGTKGDRI